MTAAPGISAAESVTIQADFNQVYTAGRTLLLNPIQSNAIFIIAALLSSSLEYLFEISGDVDSEYYQELFDVITEETLVFGVVQLLLVFILSLTQFGPAWIITLSWGQNLMAFMAVFLVFFVLFVANSNAKWRDYWNNFETVRLRQSANVNPTGDEKLYARCISKFRVTMMAYGYNTADKQVNFCDYLGAIEKRLVVKLMDMSWKSWLSMVATATINSLRATALSRDRNDWTGTDLLIPMVSYLLICGFGPLIFYYWLESSLQRRLNQYLDLGSEGMEKRLQQLDYNAQEPDRSKHHDVAPFNTADLQDPKSFLFWQSLDITLTFVQISLLQIVWFYSNAVLTMGGNGWVLLYWGSVVVIILMFVPGFYMSRSLSWTVTLMSILSSLETAADRELIDSLCGITKEMRAEEAREKEEQEKAKKEEEEKRKREEEGLPELREAQLNEEGKIKVVAAPKRPVVLDDDLTMSRVALDRKEALRMYEEIEGLRL